MGRPRKLNARQLVLQTAETMVTGTRPQDYGSAEDNFKRIANLWNAHLSNRGIIDPTIKEGVNTVDVALMCALIKMSRIENTPAHLDSWVDLAGYAACGYECAEKKDA